MKLVRFFSNGPRIGAVKHDGIVDLVAAGSRWSTMREVIDAGAPALDVLRDIVAAATATLPLDKARLLAPVERPGKYLAIGMNFKKHLEEADRLGVARAEHQFWFNKQTTCISGPYDDIDPGVSTRLDHEVELCAVIGKVTKGVKAAQALDHVFGYCVANDVSARDWQFHSPTFTMGKSFDTRGPIGPWIVTADEVPDPQQLDLHCWVNGELRQSSNTRFMLHPVAAQIEYLSTAFTLEPGDLLATGTPEGVGAARQPPVFLAAGDVVRCEIVGIGAIENRVRAART